ncbi:Crp/Fnr family transcriptional regulator [Rhodopila sp.]|uniref:Crp/Fnr family transcriptional regulator n=1 Tax=Rhodopila sp. TaxID=2480087 RepID=UPI002D7FAB30|nr:Crp/Fnr family transcriptional regulator [Rhodopila sp.]
MFIAPSIWSAGANPGHPLNAEDRAKLALIATITRFGKGETIYKKGDKAAFVYNIISGTVKTYQPLPEGGRFLSGFLFPNDLFGLAEDGAFVNAAEAATDVTVYKIPAAPLEARLRHNPTLDFQVICKLCHDLRAAQRHAFVLSRHRAVSKICLFLQMLEVAQETAGNMPKQIYLSMSRSDIGAYVGISPEAVSRCLRKLTDQKIVRFKDRRHVEVLDRQALEALTSE